MTEGQLEIFWLLVFRPKSRAIILCSTQYGKSLIVALACIVLTCVKEEVLAVVAPSDEKAKIIMRYYIEHLGDNVLFYSQLEKKTKLERLRQEESKERIMLRSGGGIFVVSAQTGNSRKTLEAAMGLGAKIVIQDEACLIPDQTEATIFRMIAGKGEEAFYCKIGNPWYRQTPYTHFWESWNDPNYYKVLIDYQQALREGRYAGEFIDEARKKPNFDILFGCEFPPENVMDAKGWVPLLTRREIELAMDGAEVVPLFGEKSFGADPADAGLNESVIVLRGQNLAEISFASSQIPLMEFAGMCIRTIIDEKINSAHAFVDAIGLGTGLAGRIQEQGQPVQPVNVAETAIDQRNFVNKRAEAFWKLRTWIREGGKLRPDERWFQVENVRYKADDSTGRLRIMSKDQMRSAGIPSPDAADALMLTFIHPVRLFQPSYEQTFFEGKMREKRLRRKKRLAKY